MQTVLGNCAGLIARPVLPAGLSGRSAATVATLAGATLLSLNFALGTPFKTDDSPAAGAGPRRWHSHSVWFLDTPRHGQKALKEP